MPKPYAESCDQNRAPILAVIEPLLAESRAVLEIASGTGQHAVFFAGRLPWLSWQTSDLEANLAGIGMWLDEATLENLPPPLALDVGRRPWPEVDADAVFTANSFHIMSQAQVEATIAGVAALLAAGGQFLVYGPFNYAGRYTSESNARFDAWLQARDPLSGIRDFETVNALAEQAGLALEGDYAMPANNRILHWRKR